MQRLTRNGMVGIPASEQEEILAEQALENSAENILLAKREGMTLTASNFRIALSDANKLGEIEDYVAASINESLKIKWQHSAHFKRLDPDLMGVAAILEWTDAEIDAVFEAGLLL